MASHRNSRARPNESVTLQCTTFLSRMMYPGPRAGDRRLRRFIAQTLSLDVQRGNALVTIFSSGIRHGTQYSSRLSSVLMVHRLLLVSLGASPNQLTTTTMSSSHWEPCCPMLVCSQIRPGFRLSHHLSSVLTVRGRTRLRDTHTERDL